MLESSKFDCPILSEHNLILCQRILKKYLENCQNILVYWSVQLYSIIFSNLADLLPEQKRYQFNWDTVYIYFHHWLHCFLWTDYMVVQIWIQFLRRSKCRFSGKFSRILTVNISYVNGGIEIENFCRQKLNINYSCTWANEFCQKITYGAS